MRHSTAAAANIPVSTWTGNVEFRTSAVFDRPGATTAVPAGALYSCCVPHGDVVTLLIRHNAKCFRRFNWRSEASMQVCYSYGHLQSCCSQIGCNSASKYNIAIHGHILKRTMRRSAMHSGGGRRVRRCCWGCSPSLMISKPPPRSSQLQTPRRLRATAAEARTEPRGASLALCWTLFSASRQLPGGLPGWQRPHDVWFA